MTWNDAEWFATQSGLPLMIKGILSPQDARRAKDVGAQAVMISNHGGRQMDTVPAPFDVVADIRDAVGNELEIVMDGGIRRGSDIVKAIARGANACSVGRPYLHALAAGGEGGVTSMFEILRSELERSMALMGLARIGDIESSILRRQ